MPRFAGTDHWQRYGRRYPSRFAVLQWRAAARDLDVQEL
jgi:hypothetical protein